MGWTSLKAGLPICADTAAALDANFVSPELTFQGAVAPVTQVVPTSFHLISEVELRT